MQVNYDHYNDDDKFEHKPNLWEWITVIILIVTVLYFGGRYFFT